MKQRRVHATLSTCSEALLSSATRFTRAIPQSKIQLCIFQIAERLSPFSFLYIHRFLVSIKPPIVSPFLPLYKRTPVSASLSTFCYSLILVRFVAVLSFQEFLCLSVGFYRFLHFRTIVCVNLVFYIAWSYIANVSFLSFFNILIEGG